MKMNGLKNYGIKNRVYTTHLALIITLLTLISISMYIKENSLCKLRNVHYILPVNYLKHVAFVTYVKFI